MGQKNELLEYLMKKFDATFEDGPDGYQPATPGKYPCHVSGFDVHTHKNSKVFNIEFTLAEECKNMQVQKHERKASTYHPINKDNGEPEMVSAGFMTGKKYRSAGVWLTAKLPEGERWKNRKYMEFFSNMGVEFPKDDKGVFQLGEVEEEDVVGMPVLADIRPYSYTNKDGSEKTSLRVLAVFPWNDGKKLEPEVPF
jgi:hypothetical protein|tara:strand:- start:31 stop:621 length:591 start_codon:yes stop_codon:yes gene_type:complete